MSRWHCFVLLLAVLMLPGVGRAESPDITAFHGNGTLTWNASGGADAVYRVEWAPEIGGPWFRNFDAIGSLDGLSATSFTVGVPMFYRVVMSTNPPPVDMVWIEGGDVQLGQVGIAEPVHTNDISGFWMDSREVNKDLWDRVAHWATNNLYSFSSGAGYGKHPHHPVSDVSWYDALKWCNARSEMEGLDPVYLRESVFGILRPLRTGEDLPDAVFWDSDGYRLPTEAEWEKAARGGRRDRLFPWGGDTISHAWANYDSFIGYPYNVDLDQSYHPFYSLGSNVQPFTSPCGVFPPNGYGLVDMAGNVAEWVWDWQEAYSAEYRVDYRQSIGIAKIRVYRGGGWFDDASLLRCAQRRSVGVVGKDKNIGFRTVRAP